MRLICLVLCFCCTTIAGFSQNSIDPRIDQVVDSLLVEGDYFRKKEKNFDLSLLNYSSALDLSLSQFGKYSAEYGQSLYRMGLLYNKVNRKKAITYFDKAQRIFTLFEDIYIDQKLKSLFNCSLLNFYEDNFNASLNYAFVVLDIKADISQIQNKTMKIIYDILIIQNRYQECLEIFEANSTKDIFRYNFDFNIFYVDLLIKLNKIAEAEKKLVSIEQIFNDTDGFSEFYRKRRLASIFKSLNQLTKAEYYYLDCERLSKTIDFNSKKRLSSLVRHKINYANFCYKTGDFKKAESIYLELVNNPNALSISYEINYALYENIAVLYIHLGSTDKASYYLDKSIEERSNSTMAFNMVSYWANKATIYTMENDLLNAKESLYKAIAYFDNSNLEDQNIKAKLYSSLAEICVELGLIAEARSYTDLLASMENLSLISLRYYRIVLAQIKIEEGNYAEAKMDLDYFVDKLDSKESLNFSIQRSILNSYIELSIKTGDVVKAREYCLELGKLAIDEIVGLYTYLPSDSREKYLELIAYKYILNIQSWAAYLRGEEMDELSLRLSLFFKGLQLKTNFNINKFVSNNTEPDLILLRDSISLLEDTPTPSQEDNLKLYALQRKLQQEFSANTSQDLLINTEIDHVKHLLKRSNAFIQFVEYERNLDDEDLFIGASILNAKGKVRFVPLCSRETLLSLLDVENKKTENTRGINVIDVRQAKVLYDSIWVPLLPYIQKKKSIYYSPTGILNMINIGILEDSVGNLVMDEHKLMLISSVASLEDKNSVDYTANKTAILIGGVDYNPMPSNRGVSYSYYWPYLSGSALEVEQLEFMLKKSFSLEIFEGQSAIEGVVVDRLKLNEVPRFIHIATHGHYEPISHNTNEPKANSTEMFNSCLVLSGANNLGSNFLTYMKADDGILHAAELTDLNLVGTELVVLSSCNSGLGDVSSFEGMFGLARALKLAGVKYVIMTLSPVSDDIQMVDFVQVFYSNWLDKGYSIPTSFNKTQDAMKVQYGIKNELRNFVLYK